METEEEATVMKKIKDMWQWLTEKGWPEHKRLAKERWELMVVSAVAAQATTIVVLTHFEVFLPNDPTLWWSSGFVALGGAWAMLYESNKMVKGERIKREDNFFGAILLGITFGFFLSAIIWGCEAGYFFRFTDHFHFDIHKFFGSLYTN